MTKAKPANAPESAPGLIAKFLATLDPSQRLNSKNETPRLQSLPAILCIATILAALLLPFVRTALRIDDPLFVWTARQIQAKPLDPYGFNVNWYGSPMPMSEVTKNPPLASYYIASAAAVLGWSETALHIAFLLAAIAVAVGMFLLAQRFCRYPMLAVLSGILTPVFFVSSLTVMSDMLMLAFWVFAVHLWITGIESRNHPALAAASLLISAAALTKYFGMMLIPLLLVYSLVKQRRAGLWIIYFAIPLTVLAWYQWKTHSLYGRGLLLDAAAYATETETQFSKLSLMKPLVALTFTGGCVASVLFYARRLWSRPALITTTAAAGVVAFLFATFAAKASFTFTASGSILLIAIQVGVWGMAGASLVALAALDLHKRRDAHSLLLFLWLFGTFVFAGFVNWAINGRSLLPLIVPAGILIARRLEMPAARQRRSSAWATVLPLVASASVALAVTWADSRFADASRAAAAAIHEKYPPPTRTTWFQGHWGFQYYMQQAGAKSLDLRQLTVVPGDMVVIPAMNTNLYEIPAEVVAVRETIDIPLPAWLATMNEDTGAGFYADDFGPLPFAFGRTQAERFTISEFQIPASK